MQWLQYGGMMLIPIALASLVGLTLFIARWRSHRRHRVLPDKLRESVLQAAAQEQWSKATEVSTDDGSPLGRVFSEGLRFRQVSRSEIRAAMEDVGRREINRLERYVGAIGALASVTPLMGLLGTVLGMIRVFQGVVQEAGVEGMVDPTALAGGIWEALVTTAAGLAVAIPLYLGYRYLLGRIDTLAVELEEAASQLLDVLAPPPGQPSALNGEASEPVKSEDQPDDDLAPASSETLAAGGA